MKQSAPKDMVVIYVHRVLKLKINGMLKSHLIDAMNALTTLKTH